MSFVVVYDANVLYPSTLRDLLIRVAQAGLIQALQTWDMGAKSPEEFVLDQIDLNREAVYGAVQRIADSSKCLSLSSHGAERGD